MAHLNKNKMTLVPLAVSSSMAANLDRSFFAALQSHFPCPHLRRGTLVLSIAAAACVAGSTGLVLAQTPAVTPPPPQPAAAAAPTVPPDLGDPGTFVIDQVSGFRGRVGGGVSYYGPVGVAYNSFSTNLEPQISGTSGNLSVTSTETTVNSWSIWLAPSLDYFIAKNISVGGLFAVDTTFGSAEIISTNFPAGSSPQVKSQIDLPTVTSFTLMPRAGYFIRFNDRLSFWPRFGLGYFVGSVADIGSDVSTSGKVTTSTQTIKSMLFQIDVGVIYQITDNVFFRVAPAIAFSTNGNGSLKYKNSTTQVDKQGSGSAFQFELSSGFGANFSL